VTRDDGWVIDSPRVGCAIYVPGISSGTLDSFEIDRTCLIDHVETTNLLVPFVIPGDMQETWNGYPETLPGDTLSFAEAVHLANCIAYDHEVPTVVQPYHDGQGVTFESIGFPREWINKGQSYTDALIQAAEAAADARFTDALEFRYRSEPALAAFSRRFSGHSEPLAMYAMALRQVDILTEYLCLYRICEWADGKNGKTFINATISSIATYDFGDLQMQHASVEPEPRSLNVFTAYRDQALERLREFKAAGIEDVGKHLYAFRNGVAHGKSQLLIHDFASNVDLVAAELPLLRLLCRIAIERPNTTDIPHFTVD
jgi:hypothetical protein